MLKLVESFSIYFYPLCLLAAKELLFDCNTANAVLLSLFNKNAEKSLWFCKYNSEEK